MVQAMELAKKFWADEEAPTAVEYALMVALIAVIIIIAVTFLGQTVANTFNYVGGQVAR